MNEMYLREKCIFLRAIKRDWLTTQHAVTSTIYPKLRPSVIPYIFKSVQLRKNIIEFVPI